MLTQEIAALIRVLRTKRGMAYEDLASIGVQRSISALEQGEVNISVSKLGELAIALDFDLVALLALCVSLQKNESPLLTLERAKKAIDIFLDCGGEGLIKDQFKNGSLIRRPRGKPANRINATEIQKLKLEGLTQTDAARILGLAKSTVSRYWQDG